MTELNRIELDILKIEMHVFNFGIFPFKVLHSIALTS